MGFYFLPTPCFRFATQGRSLPAMHPFRATLHLMKPLRDYHLDSQPLLLGRVPKRGVAGRGGDWLGVAGWGVEGWGGAP